MYEMYNYKMLYYTISKQTDRFLPVQLRSSLMSRQSLSPSQT